MPYENDWSCCEVATCCNLVSRSLFTCVALLLRSWLPFGCAALRDSCVLASLLIPNWVWYFGSLFLCACAQEQCKPENCWWSFLFPFNLWRVSKASESVKSIWIWFQDLSRIWFGCCCANMFWNTSPEDERTHLSFYDSVCFVGASVLGAFVLPPLFPPRANSLLLVWVATLWFVA